MESVVGSVLIIKLGDDQGFMQGSFHLHTEPAFDTAGDKMRCRKEKKNRWHQGEGDECQNQFGPELRPEDILLSFKNQFDNIAQDEKY